MSEPQAETAPRGERRRTQSQRTREMQERLCLATLDILTDIGYQRTSTTIICKHAGVSRGAQTHHYPSKIDLILAAFEYLLARWERERSAFFETCKGAPSPEAYIRFMWEKTFDARHYVAALELALAARGEPKLQDGLQRVLSRWSDKRDDIWQRHFDSACEGTESTVFLYMTLCLLRGMTTQEGLSNHRISNEEILKAWIEISHERIKPRTG